MTSKRNNDTHFHVWAAPDDGRSFTRTLHMDAQPHFSRSAANKAKGKFPLHAVVMECINDQVACLSRWDKTAARRGWLQCEACGRWSASQRDLTRHAKTSCSAR